MPGVTTFRAAIEEVIALGALPPGQRHTVTFTGIGPGPVDIVLTKELPVVNISVEITGLGRDLLAITRIVDNTKSFRLLEFAASSDSVIQHLTLKGGYHPNGIGGAVDNFGKLEIRDSNLTNNRASSGGAIGNHNAGELTLIDCDVHDNHALIGDGGSLFLDGSGKTSVWTSQIRLNDTPAAGRGGGIAAIGLAKEIWLHDSNIIGNFAGVGGGGIYASLPSGQPSVIMFGGNIACNWTGVNGIGGGVYLSTADASFRDVLFDGNSAADGGAFYTRNNTLILRYCTFTNNNATNQGPRYVRLGNLGQNLFITVDSCNGLTQNEIDNAAAG